MQISITVLVVALILSALIGVPLFLIIGGAVLLGYLSMGESFAGLYIEVYKIATNPVLVAIPLFTFAGYIMAESGTPRRLLNLSRALIGWFPSGLSIVAIITCALFTAFTGASGVTIIAMGGLLFPIMIKEGYKERFTLGLLTTAGSRGLLFPPSLPLILYAVIAGSVYSGFGVSGFIEGQSISVDKLFRAALLPGVLTIIALSIYSIIKGLQYKVPHRGFLWSRFKWNLPHYDFSWSRLWLSLKEAKWEIPLPIIVIWGIYGGIFTASEAAAITACYALIVEVFVYRDIGIKKDLPCIMKESSMLVGGIIVIIGMALAFTNYLIEADVPSYLVGILKEHIAGRIGFLLVLNVFLLIVGCMMDIFSAILVVVPLIVPIAMEFDVHPLHLGVIFLVNLEIGYSTPPVGLNLFISSFRFRRPIIDLYKASLPYLLILLACLLIITYVPSLSLWLVR